MAVDQTSFDLLLSVCLGAALAAACGLRIFLPPLAAAIAIKAGLLTVSASFAWLGSLPAILALAVATGLEIAAYSVPWLDNLLDALGAPLEVVAGVFVSAAAMGELQPWVRWSLAAVAGGAAAGGVHLAMALLRKISSTVTGGLGNHAVAGAEAAGATAISATAILAPLVAGAAVAVLLVVAWRAVLRPRPAPP